MKTRKTLAIFALLAAVMMAVTFTACSNDDNPVKPSLNTEIDSVVWDSTNVTGMEVYKNHEYEKDGIKVSCGADCQVSWEDRSIISNPVGIEFSVDENGGFTFTNTLGKKFTKIEFTLTEAAGWDFAVLHEKLGPGWPSGIEASMDIDETLKVTWTGKAEKVDLLVNDRSNVYPLVSRIVFYLTD